MTIDLKADHDVIREAMDRFASAMAASGEQDRDDLLRERVRFSQMFNGHILREQAALTAVETGTRDPAVVAAIQGQRRRLGILRADYSQHVASWPPTQVATDWPAYMVAVRKLQGRLRDLFAWEEANLAFLRTDHAVSFSNRCSGPADERRSERR